MLDATQRTPPNAAPPPASAVATATAWWRMLRMAAAVPPPSATHAKKGSCLATMAVAAEHVLTARLNTGLVSGTWTRGPTTLKVPVPPPLLPAGFWSGKASKKVQQEQLRYMLARWATQVKDGAPPCHTDPAAAAAALTLPPLAPCRRRRRRRTVLLRLLRLRHCVL